MRRMNFQQAYEEILARLERGEYADSDYFPSAAILADKLGASVTTIWKVISKLKKEGRLQGAFRGRPMVPGSRADQRDGTEGKRLSIRQSTSVILRQRIRRDILNGRHRHDRPLPAEKDLTSIYGVSRMTLRKSLLALVEQEVLSRRGARFSPVSIIPSAVPSQQRIVLLGQGTNIGQNIMYGYWHQESFKVIEQECARARMALDVMCFYRLNTGLYLNDELPRRFHAGTIAANPDVAGYVYLVTGPDSIEDELLLKLSETKRPVAVFDEVGIWPAMAFLEANPKVRVFRNTISTHPGRQVGRHLLGLGHRTVVYISPHHRNEYSRLRYAGLARAFSDAEGARVVPITCQDVASKATLTPGIERKIDKMRQFASAWTGSLPPLYRDPAEDLFGMLRPAVEAGMSRDVIHRLCEQALSVKDATAWVLVNDECAVWAMKFLESRKVPVPGNVSIISFDDLPSAGIHGISSFNFNYPAVMIAMLGYITNPRLYPVSRQVIEIEGQVIPRRRTLGPRGQS